MAGLEHALQQMIGTWYLTAGYLASAAVLLAGLVWYARRHVRRISRGRAAQRLQQVPATDAQTAPVRRRRPRPIPASHLEIDERPTLAHMERVPMWPNQYARPIGDDASAGANRGAPGKGRRPAKRRG